MIYTLENATLQLEVDPDLARWSVSKRDRSPIDLRDLQIGLGYRQGLAWRHILNRWPGLSVEGPETVGSPIGALRQMSCRIGTEKDELACTLTFALGQDLPILCWYLTVKNRGVRPVFIDQIDLLSAGYVFRDRAGVSGSIRFPSPGRLDPRDLAFFSNGWQSWSYSGVYFPDDRYRNTRLGLLTVTKDYNAGTPRPKREGVFSSDMFGVLGHRGQRSAVLVGFLSQREHFGSVETWIGGETPALRLWANGDGARLDPGQSLTTDWACLQILHLDDPEPLGPYLELVARQHGLGEINRFDRPPAGWCSWYYFSSADFKGALSAADVRDNLKAIQDLRQDLPLDIVQIDDGFEAQIGDWFSFDPGFPDGVAPLADEIAEAGLTPGLWLAPFIVHPKSRLAAEHPDWLLRGALGRPVNAGFLWGTFTTALDLTHTDARRYAMDAIHTAVHRWGFPYLKLDFLYAAALPGRHRDPTRTRAQVLRAALEEVREAAGEEAFLLGCGCPLGSAIGLVDAMRISADTSQRWRPAYKGVETFFAGEPAFPAAANAVHNTLTRAALHRRWWINDPDCLLLRPETRLTLVEVQTVASVIALTGGSLLLSDNLPGLPPDRFRIAKVLLPLIGMRPYILDWFDSRTPQRVQLDLEGPAGAWKLLALFNWEDRERDLDLQLNDFYIEGRIDYVAREFWSGETHLISPRQTGGAKLVLGGIPPHGVALLAMRPHRPHQPAYLGGDLHISQGLEVADWSPSADGLSFSLQRPGNARGRFELFLPKPIGEVSSGGKQLSWSPLADGRFRFDIEFEKTAKVEIRYT